MSGLDDPWLIWPKRCLPRFRRVSSKLRLLRGQLQNSRESAESHARVDNSEPKRSRADGNGFETKSHLEHSQRILGYQSEHPTDYTQDAGGRPAFVQPLQFHYSLDVRILSSPRSDWASPRADKRLPFTLRTDPDESFPGRTDQLD